MTGDDDNPYRFVDAVETEESADAPQATSPTIDDGWDVRAYVAPSKGPIYSPAEIAELGKRWSGFAVTTVVGLGMSVLLFGFLTPDGFGIALPIPTTLVGAGDEIGIGLVALAAIGLWIVIGREAYLLHRALRYPRGVAFLGAAGYMVPVTNLGLLAALGADSIVTLRRHGIRAGLFGAKADDLPRRRETSEP